jgi:hypothetical protein
MINFMLRKKESLPRIPRKCSPRISYIADDMRSLPASSGASLRTAVVFYGPNTLSILSDDHTCSLLADTAGKHNWQILCYSDTLKEGNLQCSSVLECLIKHKE